ncbi:UNVERIFIED_CONTAM: Fatty acid hydroxylase domain-containing protein 2 [Trichonephila clavipes]
MIINQLLLIPSGIIFFYLMVWRGYDSGKTLPSFQRVFFELVIHSFVNEIVFYYTHRILHRPTFYKYIHKRHHEWTVPIAISAIYSHPIEHIFSNVLTIVPSFLILGSHMSVCWLWSCMAISFTLNTHSGINFPFTPLSPEFHDYHHIKEKYGTSKAVTGSAYLDALQLWLFPQLEESEPNNFIWQQDGAPPLWHLTVRDWINIIVPNFWIGRKEPPDKACIAWYLC